MEPLSRVNRRERCETKKKTFNNALHDLHRFYCITFPCHSDIHWLTFISELLQSESRLASETRSLFFPHAHHKIKDWFSKQEKIKRKPRQTHTRPPAEIHSLSHPRTKVPPQTYLPVAGAWSTNSFAQGCLQPFPLEWNKSCLMNFSLFIVSIYEGIKRACYLMKWRKPGEREDHLLHWQNELSFQMKCVWFKGGM